MKIHTFIFNWKGYEAKTTFLEQKISSLTEVTVINSEEKLKENHPGWVNLDDTAYFSAQWNHAVRLFKGDIFFHIQADAIPGEFELLFYKARWLLENTKIAVYEPNIDFTDFNYNQSKLRELGPNLFEVPMTDSTCWFISAHILQQLPPIDLELNTYGWGICSAIAALTNLNQKLCARDYSFNVIHPRGRGYSSEYATKQRLRYMHSLHPSLGQEMEKLYNVVEKVRK